MSEHEAGPSTAAPNTAESPSAQDEEEPAISRWSEDGVFRHHDKLSFKSKLEDLIRTLDFIVWVEIAVIYFLDNSFLRFLLRAMIQLVYLMPKGPAFPEPQTQPYVGGIIGTNILCVILHLYYARPEAGEATRGYLHGGLLLDFIGQQGPTSKLHLVVLDMAIMIVQLTALAVVIKQKEFIKENTRKRVPVRPTTSSASQTQTTAPATTRTAGETVEDTAQNHDSEERGELRRLPTVIDILQSNDNSPALPADAPIQDHFWRCADILSSGSGMVAEVYIVDTVRQQHNVYQEYRMNNRVEGMRFNFGYSAMDIPFRS